VVSEVENYLGIDVGGISIKAGLINRKGDLLQEEIIPTERFANNETFLFGITTLLNKFNLSNVKSIGIGTPGPIDIDEQIILSSANLPNIKNVKLGEHLSKITTLPIFF
jgi:glucokinase